MPAAGRCRTNASPCRASSRHEQRRLPPEKSRLRRADLLREKATSLCRRGLPDVEEELRHPSPWRRRPPLELGIYPARPSLDQEQRCMGRSATCSTQPRSGDTTKMRTSTPASTHHHLCSSPSDPACSAPANHQETHGSSSSVASQRVDLDFVQLFMHQQCGLCPLT